MEIRYKDLSGSLKFAVVCAFISAGIFTLSFIIGFIQGVWYY